ELLELKVVVVVSELNASAAEGRADAIEYLGGCLPAGRVAAARLGQERQDNRSVRQDLAVLDQVREVVFQAGDIGVAADDGHLMVIQDLVRVGCRFHVPVPSELNRTIAHRRQRPDGTGKVAMGEAAYGVKLAGDAGPVHESVLGEKVEPGAKKI